MGWDNLLQATSRQSRPSDYPSLRRYVCPIPRCSQRFSRSNTLKDHLNSHRGHRPFECPVPSCSLRFGTSSNLTRHKRTKHTWLVEESPCPIAGCDVSSSSESMLDRHRTPHDRLRNVDAHRELFDVPAKSRPHKHVVDLDVQVPAADSSSPTPRPSQKNSVDDFCIEEDWSVISFGFGLSPRSSTFLDEDILEILNLLLEPSDSVAIEKSLAEQQHEELSLL